MIGDNCKQIQLGTIWSLYDPISRMKAEHEGDPRYRFIAIPVWDENEQSNFEYEHPDRYTTEKIKQIKHDLDPVDFSCLFMQRGIEKEGLAFPADDLQYFNGVLPDGEPDNVLFFCDVAFGGGDSLSLPICYVYGESAYIVDVVFDRGAKDITEPRVVGKILQHKCRMGRFEGNNGGDLYKDDIDKMLREKGYRCNISSKKAPTNMSKLSRIEQYSPEIKRFYFLDNKSRNAEYSKFMDEVTCFSYTARNLHDDSVDSLAGLAAYMYDGVKHVTVARRPF
jgi:predicted phage terminase large subunit-like protein